MDDAKASIKVEHSRGHTKKRRKRALWSSAAVLALVIVFAGGWLAAVLFQSPAQRAAQAKAPPPGSITAEVTRGSLADVVNVKVDIARAHHQTVVLAPSGSASVVTKKLIANGSKITSFEAITEVNGSPVFAVPGDFPFYRDLASGDVGPDVAQLQAGLKAAGYHLHTDGLFGEATVRAVRAAYRTAGFPLPAIAQSPSSSIDHDAAVSTAAATKVQVPLAELAVFARLPSFLLTSPPVGTTLTTDSVITAEAGPVTATARVPDAVALRLRPSMKTVLTTSDGTSIPLTIAKIDRATETPTSTEGPRDGSSSGQSAAGGTSFVTFKSMSGEMIPESALGSEAVAAITISLSAEDSLIVPSIAFVSGGSGHGWVLKRNHDGSFTKIPVDEVAQLAGQSAIALVGHAELTEHDQVKVG